MPRYSLPRRRIDRYERSPPTAETAARLTPDPLLALDLDSDELRAADEIRTIFRALTRRLQIRPAATEPGSGHAGEIEVPERIATAFSARYRPWMNSTPVYIQAAVIRLTIDRETTDVPRSEIRAALARYWRT